jgi:alanyl-tRNA synthetase
MTERLYYNDSFLREFDATVLECTPAGERWQVILDKTAFYPSSGGQPFDTGKLGDATVVDVQDREADEAVIHFTDRALATGPAHGSIDWERRFDHLQQHTGQHLLSAAFIELYGMPTVSFHLGRETSTIDIAAPAISDEQLQLVERRTNQVIFEDRPIHIRCGTAEELAAAGVRKQVKREGILRAIDITDFDFTPCGGTHASRTGQVGLILLRSCVKFKGNWRVEFVCGARALKAARADANALAETGKMLSGGPLEVPGMVSRALEDRQATYRARRRLTEQLAEVQALMFLASEARTDSAGVRTVCKLVEEQDAGYARTLATNMAKEPNVRVLLGTQEGNVIFAQSKNLEGDLGKVLRESLASAGGKGGGGRDFAQGSVPNAADTKRVLEEAMKLL